MTAAALRRSFLAVLAAVLAFAPVRVGSAATDRESDGVALRVGFASGKGHRVRELDLEDYVARVLAGEAAARSTPAVLEALAITVRTFALVNRGRHRRDGFDLCDTTHCQVLREPYPTARDAARTTAGLVLAWHGGLASIYYTASCGGMGERPSNVWPGAPDPPFLPSRRDTGCDNEPPWSSEISTADLRRALAAAGYRGRHLRGVQVRSRSASGRVLELALRGLTPDTVSGQVLRMVVGRTLGWQLIKSTEFEVRSAGRGYRFTGRGYGHGVGFCVIGATRRAATGASREALLAQYFPGTAVTAFSEALVKVAGVAAAPSDPIESGVAAVDDPGGTATDAGAVGGDTHSRPPEPASTALASVTAGGLTVSLAPGDEPSRALVTATVSRALAAAAARAGRTVPAGVRVVMHASVSDFTRETGDPAWTLAHASAARIDLQPWTALGDRPAFEAAVAHAAGHVVTAAVVTGRARWVQEGAAMFAAGEIGPRDIAAVRRLGPPRECPSDEALADSASESDGREAQARAGQCFARALAAGVRWDDIR